MTIVYREYDKNTGILTNVHKTETQTVIDKQYDAEPLIKTAAEMRAATEGQRWGEMRHVGFVPMAELGKMMRQDGKVDQKRCIQFLKENPIFTTFSKVLT